MRPRQRAAGALLLLACMGAVANAQQARSLRAHPDLTAEQEAAVNAFNRKLLAEDPKDGSDDEVSITLEDENDDFMAPAPAPDAPPRTFLDDYEAVDTCSGSATKSLDKSKYPFWLGTATSAYQVEGAARTDGRGKSIWDTFAEKSGNVANSGNGSVAIDFYNRFGEDIETLKRLGIRNFRFSVAWPRIIPAGTGTVNTKGLDFYSDLVDALLEACIEPMITLYHWDLPQPLFDMYKGWTDGQIVDDFAAYADVVFERLGDRVKTWTTLNEPHSFCMLGYGWGVHAPGRSEVGVEPWLCAYNVVRAHAAAMERLKARVPDAKASIVLNIDWAEPYNPASAADKVAVERHYDLAVRVFSDPIYKGLDMPAVIRERVPAVPKFTEAERKSLAASKPDFFALNHYTSNFIKDDYYSPAPLQYQQLKKAANGTAFGVMADADWLMVYPQGLRNVLNWVKKEFDDPAIVITENGVNVPNEGDSLEDDFRIDYFDSYLRAAESAVAEDGVDLQGYYAWTAWDNFEWADGYTTRFGMIHVDFDTLERTPKRSSVWLASQFGLLKKLEE